MPGYDDRDGKIWMDGTLKGSRQILLKPHFKFRLDWDM